jgi:ELWxxDGT repeat protein
MFVLSHLARLLGAVLVAVSLLAVLAIGAAPALARTSAVMVKDINPGAGFSYPNSLVNLNGTALFFANDGVHGYELWKSDGTPSGTTLVKDINPGPDLRFITCGFGDPLVAVNGDVFFAADDGVHGCELWRSDGTATGTSFVADINPGPANSSPDALMDFNGTLFFSADDGVHGREPWRSDGSSATTRLVYDVVPGPDERSSGFGNALAVGDTLFFIARNYDGDSEQLWRTDGTAAGTAFITRTFCAECDGGTGFLGSIDGVAMLMSGGCCRVLLRSDGTPEGTYRLDDSSFWTWAFFKRALYYFDGPYGDFGDAGAAALRRSDGTIEGTSVLLDFMGSGDCCGAPGPSGATVLDGRLLFFLTTVYSPPPRYVLSLWTSDGTAGGTRRLFDIGTQDGGGAARVAYPTKVGDTLFFVAYLSNNGWELWQTDGAVAGTYLVRDIHPGEAYSPPGDLTAVDGTLFFRADDGVHGYELWQTTPPVRSAYKNASSYCKVLEAASESPYRNHGQCVRANH